MRPFAKRVLAVGVLLIVPILLSGCIVCVDDIFSDNRPPRMATLSVYAFDYFSGMPIPWAQVELYESVWWTWDYQGTWPVGPSGHTYMRCGYLYPEGCGGKHEEDYRIVVYAPDGSAAASAVRIGLCSTSTSTPCSIPPA